MCINNVAAACCKLKCYVFIISFYKGVFCISVNTVISLDYFYNINEHFVSLLSVTNMKEPMNRDIFLTAFYVVTHKRLNLQKFSKNK